MRSLAAAAALLAAAAAAGVMQGHRGQPAPAPLAGPPAVPDAGDEFVGPFPSWANARTQFGAIGDGVADDTAALQRGLSALGVRGHSPILFVPSGIYRITGTLSLDSALNVAVVGADPETTAIVWDGAPGGTMVALDGVAYSSISRLTLDGRRTARIAIDQSWDGQRASFDTGNQYADDRFVDVGFGLRGGFKGHGFAETSVVRSRFVRNGVAGVALGNFNALDLWIWDSRFDGCEVGVSNAEGAGNFHVYSSVFRGSRVSDLAMGNTGAFSARGNDSRGSRAFFVSVVSKAYPATIHLQRNTIVDPLGSTPIDLKNQGPGLLTDNVVLLGEGARGPAVRWTAYGGADVTSVGNTFTVATPIENNGRLIAVDDRRTSASAARPPAPALPGTPQAARREIVEVPAGASARDIQKAIDRAALAAGRRPVVHFPYGTYAVSETLTIPAGDLQLIGDGAQSLLRWAGRGRGPVVRVTAPSSASIRDLQIDGAASADGLAIEGADAPGGRVRLDQVQLRAGKEADLFVDRLDDTIVEARDFGHAYSPGAPAVRVVGGPRLASGGDAPARTDVLSGASSGNGISYDVSGGAHVLVRDFWYESGAAPGFARVHDRAIFSLDGSRVASAVGKGPAAVDVADLRGNVVVAASHIDDRVAIVGDGRAARVLALATFHEQESASVVRNTASPPAHVAVVNSRQKAAGARGNASAPLADSGTWDPAYITALLAHVRFERPWAPSATRSSLPDVRLFRLWVVNGVTNVTIR